MAIQELRAFQTRIKTAGKLSSDDYWASVRQVFGKSKVLRPGNVIARSASALTSTAAVGEQPEGFGKGITWDRKNDAILLVMFINAADGLGVSIAGVETGDNIQIQSCAGLASFAKDTGNPLASSIVALVGVGAKVGVGLAGFPEAIPLVNAAEAFAQEQFKATNAKTKIRDAFGVQPSSGLKARQEGGVIISLPEASGPLYSGDSDHKERWIKKPGDRITDNLPEHVRYCGFFPIRGAPAHNTRKLGGAGQIYVTPWDYKFEDNAGYYKVFLQITKGQPLGPPPIIT